MTTLPSARDNFPARVRAALAERVAFLCSRPGCRRPTIGPHSDATKALRVGRACHILGAAPGGPRYDSKQPAEERTSITNGIWLCAVCSDIVDKDEASFPPAQLRAWKEEAEAEALKRLNTDNAVGLSDHVRHDPAAVQVEVARLLDSAFDALAGSAYSSRLTWRSLDDRSMEQARRAIRDAELMDPSCPRLPIVRAALLVAQKFPDKALEVLDDSSKGGSEDIELVLMRSVCLSELGRIEESLRILQALRGAGALVPTVHYNIGYALHRLGRPEEAETALLEATARDPNYGEAFQLLGRIAYERRDIKAALRAARKARALRPDDDSIAKNCVLCLLDLQELGEAEGFLRPLAEQYPNDAEVLQLRGRLHAQRGDLSAGEAFIRRALDEEPHDPVALHNLGMVLLYGRRFDEAQAAFENAQAAGYPEQDDIPGRVQAVRKAIEGAGL